MPADFHLTDEAIIALAAVYGLTADQLTAAAPVPYYPA